MFSNPRIISTNELPITITNSIGIELSLDQRKLAIENFLGGREYKGAERAIEGDTEYIDVSRKDGRYEVEYRNSEMLGSGSLAGLKFNYDKDLRPEETKCFSGTRGLMLKLSEQFTGDGLLSLLTEFTEDTVGTVD